MVTLVSAIITGAIALVAGMLLSKVYFTTRVMKNSLSREAHEEALKKQARHDQDKVSAVQNKARLKISSLNEKIEEKDREIVRLLSDACNKETVADSSLRKLIDIQRTEITSLRENLESRDARIQEINLELRKSQTETQQFTTKFNTLQARVEPLTRRLQAQQATIRGLEEKLALAMLGDRAPKQQRAGAHASGNAGPAGNTHADPLDEPTLEQPREQWHAENATPGGAQITESTHDAASGDEPTLEQPREQWHAENATPHAAPIAVTGDEPTLMQPRDQWRAETATPVATQLGGHAEGATASGDEPTLVQPRDQWHAEAETPADEAAHETAGRDDAHPPEHVDSAVDAAAEERTESTPSESIFMDTATLEANAALEAPSSIEAGDEQDCVDDLKKIRGIGPALERRLNETGIHKYRQIAQMSKDELADVAEKISISPAVAARYNWIEQARALQQTPLQ